MEYQKYQLTNPQKSIYLTEKFYNGTSINNICGTCIIHSELNFELLQQAIKILIANNDNFKIHFQSKNNTVQQFISQTTMPEIEIININEYEQDFQNISYALCRCACIRCMSERACT